jgi:hypothetical protein
MEGHTRAFKVWVSVVAILVTLPSHAFCQNSQVPQGNVEHVEPVTIDQPPAAVELQPRPGPIHGLVRRM